MAGLEWMWRARKGCGGLGKAVENWARLWLAWKACGGLGKAAVGLKRLWRARGGCGWLGKDVEVRKGSGGLGEAVES